MNLLPDFLKGFLQLYEFCLQPLYLLSNLKLLAEFIELLAKLGDNFLGIGNVAEVETLKVVSQSSLSSI